MLASMTSSMLEPTENADSAVGSLSPEDSTFSMGSDDMDANLECHDPIGNGFKPKSLTWTIIDLDGESLRQWEIGNLDGSCIQK